MLPTSGLFDFHRHAGLLISALGLETASFVFLLCNNKTHDSLQKEADTVVVECKNTREQEDILILDPHLRQYVVLCHVLFKRRTNSAVHREEMRMRNGGMRGRRKHTILFNIFPIGSLGQTAAETMSWTCMELEIFKFEFWSALLVAAFIKIRSRLVFVLRMKRNIPTLGDRNPN